MALQDLLGGTRGMGALLGALLLIVVLSLVTRLLLRGLRKRLDEKGASKRHVHNVRVISRLVYYSFLALIAFIIALSFSGDWTGLGVGLGLFSAALGWALQKPITGIAGWIMVITTRIFRIGDRIVIGSTRGDVVDISLTHISLREIGGVLPGEEDTGRIVLVPNSLLFDNVTTNYTVQSDVLLSEVTVAITYGSDLDTANALALEAARDATKDYLDSALREPYVYMEFLQSGINIKARFFVPASRQDEVKSAVTKGIYDRFHAHKSIRFAYQHYELYVNTRGEARSARPSRKRAA